MSNDEICRLALVAHLRTEATQAARFPRNEGLLEREMRSTREPGKLERAQPLRGPERRVLQTATVYEIAGAQERAELADLNVGEWAGVHLGEIPPADLAQWMSDPEFAGHGGESVTKLIARVAAFLHTLPTDDRVAAFTSPAVVRAAVVVALDAPASAWFCVDAGPGSVVKLHRRSEKWRLRL